MKNDNRLYRPEQLTEAQKRAFAEGLNSYTKKQHEKEKINEAKREEEKARKIASGEWIEVDGKVYDARYYKGNK